MGERLPCKQEGSGSSPLVSMGVRRGEGPEVPGIEVFFDKQKRE